MADGPSERGVVGYIQPCERGQPPADPDDRGARAASTDAVPSHTSAGSNPTADM